MELCLLCCIAIQSFLFDITDTCPNPSITKFYPSSGPKEGGTDVTIEGLNLGQKYEDIRDGVLVAGIVCVPYKGKQKTCST